MDEKIYCAFCGRVIKNEYCFCPFCGVQSKDFPGMLTGSERALVGIRDGSFRSTIHRLEEMETTLTDMEHELDHFISSKKA